MNSTFRSLIYQHEVSNTLDNLNNALLYYDNSAALILINTGIDVKSIPEFKSLFDALNKLKTMLILDASKSVATDSDVLDAMFDSSFLGALGVPGSFIQEATEYYTDLVMAFVRLTPGPTPFVPGTTVVYTPHSDPTKDPTFEEWENQGGPAGPSLRAVSGQQQQIWTDELQKWAQQPSPVSQVDPPDSSDSGIAQNDAGNPGATETPDPNASNAPPVNPVNPTPPNPNNTGNATQVTSSDSTTTTNVPHIPGFTNIQPAQRRYIGGIAGFPVGGAGSTGSGDGVTWLGIDGGDYAHTKNKGKGDNGLEDGTAKPGSDGEDPGGHDAVVDENRGRYSDDSDSGSTGSSPNKGVDGGSGGDDPGQQDRDRNTWTGRKDVVSGGYNDNRGHPDPIQRGDPNPDDDSGSESRPSIPYGPRHNNVGPLILPNDPNSPANVRKRYLERILLQRLRMYGYASGDDLGSAGYNPHFDPDPENTGDSASESGDGGPGFGPMRPNVPGPYGGGDESPAPSSGPDPDNEWGAGGYNPHYQPGGYTLTPSSRGVVGTTRVAPARVQVMPAIRFK
jgi:hypothetical protein